MSIGKNFAACPETRLRQTPEEEEWQLKVQLWQTDKQRLFGRGPLTRIDRDKQQVEAPKKSVSRDSGTKLKEVDFTPRKLPKEITEPCARFFERHSNLLNLITDMISQWEDSGASLANMVLETERLQLLRNPERIKLLKTQAQTLQGLLGRFDLLVQLVYCGVVDNYLSYVSELLALIFRTRPETLRSGEKEKLDEILAYSTMEDLISALAEKRVNHLSYQGMEELSKNLSRGLGLELFPEADDMARAVLIIETRNLIVHNRGIINERSLSKAPNIPGKIGDSIDFADPYMKQKLFLDIQFLAHSVADVEQRACVKFDLPRPVSGQDLKLSRDLK
ncbi:MAG: hypothetical protein ACE5IP_03700 [Terriglobia bacterium]